MADAEEIARDIVVALLPDNITELAQLVPSADPTRVGEALGERRIQVHRSGGRPLLHPSLGAMGRRRPGHP